MRPVFTTLLHGLNLGREVRDLRRDVEQTQRELGRIILELELLAAELRHREEIRRLEGEQLRGWLEQQLAKGPPQLPASPPASGTAVPRRRKRSK